MQLLWEKLCLQNWFDETYEERASIMKSVQAKKGQNVPKDVITGIKDYQEALKDYDKKWKYDQSETLL